IGKRLRIADRTLDANGRLTLPGIIDPHVHFRSPGEEYKEDWASGSKAAVAGGVTTVLDMPNNRPPIITKETLEAKRRAIAGKSYVNYGLYIGATENNFDEIMRAKNAKGVKIYLGSSTGGLLLQDYGIVEKILEHAPCIVACHSEDERCLIQNSTQNPASLRGWVKTQNYGTTVAQIHDAMRPEKCAVESARCLVEISERIKKPIYICHVSAQKELAVFLSAKQKGLPIYLEATPHHLFLDIKSAGSIGNFARVNPPIRSVSSKKALQKALQDGIIDTIGSDHAPHTKEEKGLPYQDAPSGMPGVETMLPLMLDFTKRGKFTMKGLVRCMAENPARIFNIQKRGSLSLGFFGDIVIMEENLTRIVETNRMYTKCGWSAFAGLSLNGFPYATIVNGEIAFLNGRIAENPAGRDIAA
ncbi:MAG: dihydroorotase, partial [Candidatus Jacksonbacteria bacterium]|nr:dihydroorotase [Candidatus Jacksonbacteria bacterium]